ncbi:cupin-like domain-containing protein [Phaeobacter sp. 11ANDIMAR09]|uniref:cupin-like domain-containing protein n=1 Tax=Phaeobacter sp. 11ANDIMAR09 TaxID=1225647 RepID=UPI0006C85177|nr:cupin-like domain-containing protein [Phaeobacter sp. 11ANDIMAR09]
MNVAYPAPEFASAEETVNGLIQLLEGGFENPYEISGTVLVQVVDHPELDFLAVFGEALKIVRPIHEHPVDTRMTFPLATLETIFRDYEILDWRSPEILGTVELEGNLDLAFQLGMSCVRPSNTTIDRLAALRALHKKKGHRNLDEVVRLHLPSQHQLLEAIDEGLPTIITGLEPSPPCKDWTIDWLVEKYGDSIVCRRSSELKITLRELADQMRLFEEKPELENDTTLDKAYTEGVKMPHEMWDDFGPMFFDREDFIPAQLWLGSVSTNTPATALHCDPTTGFLFQVMGRKRLELFSADQADLLYPKKAYSYYQSCWFNPHKPRYDLFPKAKGAKSISVDLHPGELLVQPAGWFHQVFALDSPTMSVSYFWRY